MLQLYVVLLLWLGLGIKKHTWLGLGEYHGFVTSKMAGNVLRNIQWPDSNCRCGFGSLIAYRLPTTSRCESQPKTMNVLCHLHSKCQPRTYLWFAELLTAHIISWRLGRN